MILWVILELASANLARTHSSLHLVGVRCGRLALNDLSHMSGTSEEMAKTSNPFSLSTWSPSLKEAGPGLLKRWWCSQRARWEALRPHEVETWKFSSIISYVFFSKASYQPHPESRDGEMTLCLFIRGASETLWPYSTHHMIVIFITKRSFLHILRCIDDVL